MKRISWIVVTAAAIAFGGLLSRRAEAGGPGYGNDRRPFVGYAGGYNSYAPYGFGYGAYGAGVGNFPPNIALISPNVASSTAATVVTADLAAMVRLAAAAPTTAQVMAVDTGATRVTRNIVAGSPAVAAQ